jgi:hemoglobin
MGGEPAIKDIVDNFYRHVWADEIVSHFFDHTDMEKQRHHQTAFISYALGGPKQYSGRSMEEAHAGLNLQPEHFDAIVKHLTDAIIAHGVYQMRRKTPTSTKRRNSSALGGVNSVGDERRKK